MPRRIEMPDIRTKIRNGDYKTKLPWADQSRPDYRKRREAHRLDTNRLVQQFKSDLLAEWDLTNHPKASRLWDLAWDHGHGEGLSEVLCHFEEMATLLDPVPVEPPDLSPRLGGGRSGEKEAP